MDDKPPSSWSSSTGRLRALLPGPTREGGSSTPPPKLDIPKRISVKTACQACRQRKAKVCNGQRPRCSGCITAGRECHYAINHYEAEAAAMKRKHNELKERMTDHERLYSSLKTREPHETDEILQRIRAGKDVKGVTEDLEGGNPAAATSGSASSTTLARLTASHDQPEKARREPQRRVSGDSTSIDFQGHILPFSRWTSVIQDDKFLSHLLLLFWTWGTSCNRIIDRTIFEDDLKNLDPTTPGAPSALRFCSQFLVNAVLAVSCLYTTNPITFSIPDELSTRGQIFAQEAIQCLKKEDTRPSLPVAQGLALMYVYEGALGNGETALQFHNLMQSRYTALRLDDIYRSTDTAIAGSRQRAEAHALSWIQWGFYVWDWKPMHGLCRRLAITKPARTKTWLEENSPVNRAESSEYWWSSYPASVAPRRSMKREIFEAECNFTEITEQVLEFLIPLEQGVPLSRNTGRAVELYSRIMEWKFSLPEELRAEHAVLPAAILLHLSADLVVISILQPFDHIPKSVFGLFHPRLTSYAHATNAMSTIWHFRALYTIHNEHWLIQACSVCAFKVIFAIEESPIQLETFIKACRALAELREAFPVAQEVIHSIESVVKNKKVNLPSYAREYMPNGAGEGVGDLKGVSVRDHSVIVEKADSDGSEGRLTMTGLLSTLTPSETGLY
ncbi:pathway-specific regulatory nit-4 [Fusarium sp. NRRL 52700]|nr:pathway-specific regulatory nit-4 [Fusarium sp. NRRL 52700]